MSQINSPVFNNLQENKLLHQLFEQSADLFSDNIAIENTGIKFTYAAVERSANQLAHYLVEKGVGPDQKVAIMLPRTAFVYIAMLGVLKAGGAYIPIDPEIPGERVDFIMKDSGALLLISSGDILERIGTVLKGRNVFNVDKDISLLKKFPDTRVADTNTKATGLCYI